MVSKPVYLPSIILSNKCVGVKQGRPGKQGRVIQICYIYSCFTIGSVLNAFMLFFLKNITLILIVTIYNVFCLM